MSEENRTNNKQSSNALSFDQLRNNPGLSINGLMNTSNSLATTTTIITTTTSMANKSPKVVLGQRRTLRRSPSSISRKLAVDIKSIKGVDEWRCNMDDDSSSSSSDSSSYSSEKSIKYCLKPMTSRLSVLTGGCTSQDDKDVLATSSLPSSSLSTPLPSKISPLTKPTPKTTAGVGEVERGGKTAVVKTETIREKGIFSKILDSNKNLSKRTEGAGNEKHMSEASDALTTTPTTITTTLSSTAATIPLKSATIKSNIASENALQTKNIYPSNVSATKVQQKTSNTSPSTPTTRSFDSSTFCSTTKTNLFALDSRETASTAAAAPPPASLSSTATTTTTTAAGATSSFSTSSPSTFSPLSSSSQSSLPSSSSCAKTTVVNTPSSKTNNNMANTQQEPAMTMTAPNDDFDDLAILCTQRASTTTTTTTATTTATLTTTTTITLAQFPTPLPPTRAPPPPLKRVLTSRVNRSSDNSGKSSIGVVLGTKRCSSSSSSSSLSSSPIITRSFGVTRARQKVTPSCCLQQKPPHLFGLSPNEKVGNSLKFIGTDTARRGNAATHTSPGTDTNGTRANTSTATGTRIASNNILPKTDTTLGSHQPRIVANRKSPAICRFTDGNVEALESKACHRSSKDSKKKRCADRYDSSESSDSGVATSLSCTDSSTASSEDASEPGSPYSPQSNLSEEQQHQQQHLLSNNKMAPQTVLGGAAAANSTNTATENTSNTLPTATNASNSTVSKLQSVQKPLPLQNNCNNTANNKLPSLQMIGCSAPPNAQPVWPWVTNSTTPTTPTTSQSKKRNSLSAGEGAAKKARTTHSNAQSSVAASSAPTNSSQIINNSKRLKAPALEESQTKITGYFKSQMKTQQIQSKRPELLPASSTVMNNGMTSNALTMSTPATTASLNKYFNILSQIKENNNQRDQQQQQQKAIIINNSQTPATTSSAGNSTNNITNSSTASSTSTTTTTMLPVPALKKIERSKPTKIAQVAPNLRKPYTPNTVNSNSNSNSSYSAASTIPGKSPKKHVAIAPRTPDMKPNQMNGKEIITKHQAILPQQQQQPTVLLTAIRVPATPSVGTHQQSAATTQQHAVGVGSAQAVAALKQQPQQGATTTVKVSTPTTVASGTTTSTTALFQLPVQMPNLVQLPHLLATTSGANILQLSNAAANKTTAQAAAAATAAAATTAQAAQAAAAQYFLNGTVFKLQQFTTATTTTATSAVASAGGPTTTVNPFSFMHANDLQELLLKQQQQQQQQIQIQPKNSSAATVGGPTNFQEMFQQQVAAAVAATQQQQLQQQFQQLQRLTAAPNNLQQPIFMATPAGLLLNAASLPTMLAQAVAAIAANNHQQQQQQQQQQHQHQHKAITLQQQQQTLPALQPIQAAVPSLSSIFSQSAASSGTPQSLETNIQELQQQQQHFQQHLSLAQQQHHQQFVTASQPPPLSVVSTNSAANATVAPAPTPKLAIVKASPGQFPVLSSQPPPLVTISSGNATNKMRTQISPAGGSVNHIKPSALAKPYQKRSPKIHAATSVQSSTTKANNSAVTTKSGGKLIATASKIVASSTTPPPLVPASNNTNNAGTLLASAHTMPTFANPQAAPPGTFSQIKPTPALVSIATNNPPLVKFATSVATSMSSTPTHSSGSNGNFEHQIKSSLPPTTNDLFDIVKNSTAPIASTTTISPSPILFHQIKEEPLDELPDVQTETTSAEPTPAQTTYCPDLSMDIKIELLEDSSKLVNSNTSVLQECSSSSFECSHSNSISSSADLSLEASTAASLTSSAPSPAPSNESAAVRPSSACDSNSNSCATTTAASLATSQDHLNDLSIMSSSVSSSSSSSLSSSSSSSSPQSNTCSLHLSLTASINSQTCLEKTTNKRETPTPESGIGGSLSSAECNNFLETSCSRSSGSKGSSAESDIGNSLSNTSTSTVPESPSESLSTECPAFTISPSIVDESPLATTPITPTTVDIQLAETSEADLPKAAISPILSQPKTIRFPASSGLRYGPKGANRNDGVCYWHKCNKKHDSSSKLLDHMQTYHVNSQTGPFACLWVGCKVYNKESCSRRWLERHVLSHGGSKQFKCIVEGCGLRFGSQLALQKHVNNHFTATENKESTNKRTSDPPVPKQLRKNGKKLRYRRQPFSARMFDFFDAGIMEGLQHRLRQISTLTQGRNSITFQGQCLMRRKNVKGEFECFVRWSPKEIIPDEWLPESSEPYTKTVNIKQLRPAEKTIVESLLMTAYRLPYSPNLWDDGYVFGSGSSGSSSSSNSSHGGSRRSSSGRNKISSKSVNKEEDEDSDAENSNDTGGSDDENHDDDDDDDDDNDGDDDDDDEGNDAEDNVEAEEEDEKTPAGNERQIKSSRCNEKGRQQQEEQEGEEEEDCQRLQVLNIAQLQIQQRRKHPRKPQKRISVMIKQQQQINPRHF